MTVELAGLPRLPFRRIASKAGSAVLLLLAAQILSGCPKRDASQDATADPQPYAGVDVRVILPGGYDLATAWTPGFEDWAAGAAASYTVREIDFSQSNSDNDAWLETLRAESAALVLLPTTAVPRLLADGLAAPIPGTLVDTDGELWRSVPSPVRKALGMQGDKPTVLPVTSATLVLFYRTDLLARSGRSVPRTWDEYDELVATVTEWAPGLTAIEPRGAESLVTLFLARSAAGAKSPTQYSFELDISTGDPLISSGAFVRTAEAMSRLTPDLADDARSASFTDCMQAALTGRAAIGIAAIGTDGLADAESAAAGTTEEPVATDLEFAPLPGSRDVFNRETAAWEPLSGNQLNRPALCGFGGLCVCVLSTAPEREQAAAWDLLRTLSAVQEEGVIPAAPGLLVRESGLSASLSRQFSSLSAASQRSLEQAVLATFQSPQLIAELPCHGRQTLLNILDDALRSVLEHGEDAGSALDRAAESWRGILDEMGRRDVLNNYRRRLGLGAMP